MGENEALQEHACKILYHLGKGLWKSVPVLGPLVDELVYEQFRDDFLEGGSKLTEHDLQQISELLPNSIDPEDFEHALEALTENIQDFVSHQLSAISISINRLQEHALNTSLTVSKNIDHLTLIEEIVKDIKEQVSDQDALNLSLQIITQRQREWIYRISENQTKLLNGIPDNPIPVNTIWKICQKLIPSCVYKEFRFRLHELEWLGLVERFWKGKKNESTWMYQRTELGKKHGAVLDAN